MKIAPFKPKTTPATDLEQAAAALVDHLAQATVGAPIHDLAERFDQLRDDFDVRKKDFEAIATLALQQMQEPQHVIDDVLNQVAGALKLAPEQKATMAQAVAAGFASLAAQAPVSADAFDAAMRAPVEERRQTPAGPTTSRPFGARLDMPAKDYHAAVTALATEMREKIGDGSLTKPLVEYFIERFEQMTGVRIARAPDLQTLLRDFGDVMRSLLEREMPITVIAGDNPIDEQAARDLIAGMRDELKERGLEHRIAVLGRFGGTGAHKATMTVFEQSNAVDRIVINAATKDALTTPAPFIDKAALYGNTAGEQTFLFRELARRGAGIVFGGDQQSIDDAKDILDRNPARTFVLGGFNDNVDALKNTGATFLPDARQSPTETGRAIGKQLADAIEQEQRDLLADPLLQLVFKGSKGQLSDMVTSLQQNAAQNRIVRITTAVGERLERAGVPKAEVWQEMLRLGQNLATYTIGVDNFRDNALWQQRAKEAFAVTGGRINDIVNEAAIDIYFASWGGIQRKAEEPNYFELNTSKLPDEPRLFDYNAPSTMLDLNKYCYKRLDTPIAEMLKKACDGDPEQRPEVFLGSEAELKAYYTAKGFSTSYNTFDSNGTYYMVFQRGNVVRPVIFGVDSPARMTQITALMAQAGVDTDKITVRGNMDRVRLEARNKLEEDLNAVRQLRAQGENDTGPGIAGVVINNTADAIAAIAESAGVSSKDVRVMGTRSIGPFRYEVLEVQGVGRKKPDLILCFKPAYGELTQDLVNACLSAGARNFLIGGAAGSLVNEDAEFGAMHRVTQVDYNGQHIDLAAAGLSLLNTSPALKQRVTQDNATNVFHPSPPMQSQAVAAAIRQQHPRSSVDQESAVACYALAEAKRQRATESLKPGEVLVQDEIFVSTFVHQSDIVGRGYLELGTVDANYSPNVKATTKAWAEALGIKSVTTTSGVAQVRGAKAGKLATQAPTNTAPKITMPSLSSISVSSDYSLIDQFKGQKRCIVLDCKNASASDLILAEKALSQLDPQQYWIVVNQGDSEHGELLKLAARMKFESVLLTTTKAAENDEILGTPTFTIYHDDAAGIAAAQAELSTRGTRYEWEENDAQHYRFRIGDFRPQTTPLASELYTSRMRSEYDAVDAGEAIREELKQAHLKIRDGLTAGATGQYVSRGNETLLQLAARFGLVDLRGGLDAQVAPPAREIARLLIGDTAASMSAKELKAALQSSQFVTRPAHEALLAEVALVALKARDSWRENVGSDEKLAQMRLAAINIVDVVNAAELSLPADASAARAALQSLTTAAQRVHDNGVDHALNALNPGVDNFAPLAAKTSVKIREGQARTPPHVISSSFYGTTLAGRRPLYLTGASAKSWPLMSPEDRASVLKRYRLLAKILDPSKVSILTGLTAFGADKFVQETFGPAGFQMVCVATENTLKDLKDVTPWATHVLLAGNNWFGKSRTVGQLVEDHNGDMIVDGGGAIMLAEILQAIALQVRTHLRDGLSPSEQGEKEAQRLRDAGKPVQLFASTEQAATFKAHAFSATKDLLIRLGISTDGLSEADLSDQLTPELLREVLDVNKEQAAMARYGLAP